MNSQMPKRSRLTPAEEAQLEADAQALAEDAPPAPPPRSARRPIHDPAFRQAVSDPLLSASSVASAPLTPPPGVKANVTVKYEHEIDPERMTGSAHRGNGQEATDDTDYDDQVMPFDPLSAFCDEWAQYAGHTCKIVRLPDPATRRIPGQSYRRPCWETELLGEITFDPANLPSSIQLINGNSGGVFRIALVDHYNRIIQGAILDRLAIADPPQWGTGSRAAADERGSTPITQPAAAPPPPKTDFERNMERLQTRMMERMLDNLMNPPEPAPVAAAPQISEEDRLGALLVKEGGLLGRVVEKVSTALQSVPDVTERGTWKDRLADRFGELMLQNPQVAERLGNVAANIVARIFPNPAPPVNYTPVTYYPPGTPAPISAPATAPPPEGYTDYAGAPAATVETNSYDPESEQVEIIEELTALLLDNREITATEPLFIQLRKDYPRTFPMTVRLIAAQPLDDIVEWLKDQSPIYDSLLTGPLHDHLYARLQTLQELCRQATQKKPTPAASSETAPGAAAQT